MYVYPAMRKHLPDGEKSVEHDIEEHKELEQAMKQLEAVDVSSTEFDTALRRLETLLADHVQDEETGQFPELRSRIPQDELIELAGKVEATKNWHPPGLTPVRPTTSCSTSSSVPAWDWSTGSATS
jgi:hypothetical protein